MDSILWTLFLIFAVPIGLYWFVSYYRRVARRAELGAPSTVGHVRGLSSDIGSVEMAVSDVSSSVADIRKELGDLQVSLSGIQEGLDALRFEVTEVGGGVGSDIFEIREELDDIRSDLKAMRRLHRAIAHHQWTPEWTPE
jgi:hypothetical protein